MRTKHSYTHARTATRRGEVAAQARAQAAEREGSPRRMVTLLSSPKLSATDRASVTPT